ncbi:hypothetical protein EJ08DRAFT_657535 [Tothia fuscella]|uniref:Uncharacterized protein n=1 Tax=Tothia fuscella TaxID=1048955 RepID=A0A9P4NZR5_9PEZI|nr:hypothetical protein EJ08DRAFT_657535 [Tothia fuscella]
MRIFGWKPFFGWKDAIKHDVLRIPRRLSDASTLPTPPPSVYDAERWAFNRCDYCEGGAHYGERMPEPLPRPLRSGQIKCPPPAPVEPPKKAETIYLPKDDPNNCGSGEEVEEEIGEILQTRFSVSMIDSKRLNAELNKNVLPKLFKTLVVMSPSATLFAYSDNDNIKDLRDRMSLVSLLWQESAREQGEKGLEVLTIEIPGCNVIAKLIIDGLLIVLVGGSMPKFHDATFKVTKSAPGDKRYPTDNLEEKRAIIAKMKQDEAEQRINIKNVTFSDNNRFYSPAASSTGYLSTVNTQDSSDRGNDRNRNNEEEDPTFGNNSPPSHQPLSRGKAPMSDFKENTPLPSIAVLIISDNKPSSSNNKHQAESSNQKSGKKTLSPQEQIDVELGPLHVQRVKIDRVCQGLRDRFNKRGFKMPPPNSGGINF